MAIYQNFDTGEIFTTAELLKIYNDYKSESGEENFDDFFTISWSREPQKPAVWSC